MQLDDGLVLRDGVEYLGHAVGYVVLDYVADVHRREGNAYGGEGEIPEVDLVDVYHGRDEVLHQMYRALQKVCGYGAPHARDECENEDEVFLLDVAFAPVEHLHVLLLGQQLYLVFHRSRVLLYYKCAKVMQNRHIAKRCTAVSFRGGIAVFPMFPAPVPSGFRPLRQAAMKHVLSPKPTAGLRLREDSLRASARVRVFNLNLQKGLRHDRLCRAGR